jgi:hypothetical protein
MAKPDVRQALTIWLLAFLGINIEKVTVHQYLINRSFFINPDSSEIVSLSFYIGN